MISLTEGHGSDIPPEDLGIFKPEVVVVGNPAPLAAGTFAVTFAPASFTREAKEVRAASDELVTRMLATALGRKGMRWIGANQWVTESTYELHYAYGAGGDHASGWRHFLRVWVRPYLSLKGPDLWDATVSGNLGMPETIPLLQPMIAELANRFPDCSPAPASA